MSGFEIGGPQDWPRAKLLGADRIDERPAARGGSGGGFAAALGDALAEVDRLGDAVSDQAEALARGEPVEVHDLMIAMGKSEVAFNLMLEVRNKMIEAWQELSRSVT